MIKLVSAQFIRGNWISMYKVPKSLNVSFLSPLLLFFRYSGLLAAIKLFGDAILKKS